MKKKLFMLLALAVMTLTASAEAGYDLKVGTSEHGTITFKVGDNANAQYADEGDVVTVTITPATGWVVNQPSGQWYAAIAAAPQRRTSDIDLLKDVTLTPVAGKDNQWTFTMARANVEISATYKKLLTHTDITIQDITALTYTGLAQEPTVTVKDGSAVLVKGTDYTVAYSNNTNAALATATTNAPTVTITAVATSDKYAGEITKTFTINKAALTVTAEDKTVTFGDDAPTFTVSYSGFVNNETATVLGGTLAYTCDYVKNTSGAGNYDITPSGLTADNYAITFTAGKLTVGKKALESSMIAAIEALTYNGTAQTPEPVVTFNEMTLEAGTDYTVAYANNTAAALATATENAPTVTITATETSNYSGEASVNFTIQKKALTITAEDKTATFGDAAPEYTVTYDGFENNETATVLGGELALACDYVQNETGVGEYAITPSGLTSDNYAITFTAGKLTVGKKALESSMIAAIEALTYNGTAQTPEPVVTFNEMTLEAGTDYTVAYANNTAAALATATENAPTVTITAVATSNKYAGEITKTFTINKAALTVTAEDKTVTFGDDAPTFTVSYSGFVNNETATVLGGTLAYTCDYVKNTSGAGNYDITPSGLTADNYAITFTAGKLTVGKKALENSMIADIEALTYTGAALTPAPVVTFNDMTLVAGEDKDYTVAYSNNVNAGTATVTVTTTENCNYSGSASKTFTINKKALESSMIGAIDVEMTYTGNAFTPEPAVTYNEMTLVKGTDFAYSYENNVNAALATATEKAPTVTVTAAENSNYSGSASKTFTINKAEITSMTAPTIDELTYNGQDQALVNAGSVEGGAVHYSLDGETYAADVPTGKDAGSYLVYYKVVPDDNHFTNLAAKFVLQTIYKAALTGVTVESTDVVYNKQEQIPVITSVQAGEFTVSADDYTVSGTGLNIGTYMMTVAAKSTAKNFTGTTSIQFNIVAKTVGLTWSKTTMDANGQEQLPELTLTGIEEGDACTATVTGAGTAVGSYTAKVTALSNENYALPEDSLCDFIIVRDMSNLFSDSYEWTTYVAQEDLATPAGLQAYVVSKVTTTTIEAAAVGYIPVGTGVLLKRSDKATNIYKGKAYEGTPANIASLLKGSATEATKLGDYKDFLLFRDEFVMSSTNSIPAGRAYLPAAEVPANAAPALVIAFGDATGIEQMVNGKSVNGTWYDLNGRKLQNVPTKKGMYILNGKKVVVK